MLDAWFAIEDGELVVRWVVASLESVKDIPRAPSGSTFGGCWNLDFWINDRYLALWVQSGDGNSLTAAERHQWLAGNNQPDYEMGTHHVDNALSPVEISFGSPAILTARYDSGAFPLQVGDSIHFETKNAAHSCLGGPTETVDAFIPGAPFVVPIASWRPPASGNAYDGVNPTGPIESCAPPEVPPLCLDIASEDRGARYVLTTVPPVPVSNVQGMSTVALTFTDDSGNNTVYGEPGGFPRRATRFSFSSTVPILLWHIEVVD